MLKPAALLAAAALCLGLCACGGAAGVAPGTAPAPPAAPESAAPPAVSPETDACIGELAAYLLGLAVPETPAELEAVFAAVDTGALGACADELEAAGLDGYATANGGVFVWENSDGQRDLAFFAGHFEASGARSGPRCVWVTLHAEDRKLYFGPWDGDYPEGDFTACTLTTNSGNLIVFSGACRRGVWDGPVAVRYVDPDLSAPLAGGIECGMGRAPVAYRPDGEAWNDDPEKRFCFLALNDGELYIPLYRDWAEQDFVINLAFDASLIRAG